MSAMFSSEIFIDIMQIYGGVDAFISQINYIN